MSKLIHISAPSSSTDEERKAEEKRVQRMFPSAGVVCLLEGWKIDVYDVPQPRAVDASVHVVNIPVDPERIRKVALEAIESAAGSHGSEG